MTDPRWQTVRDALDALYDRRRYASLKEGLDALAALEARQRELEEALETLLHYARDIDIQAAHAQGGVDVCAARAADREGRE